MSVDESKPGSRKFTLRSAIVIACHVIATLGAGVMFLATLVIANAAAFKRGDPTLWGDALIAVVFTVGGMTTAFIALTCLVITKPEGSMRAGLPYVCSAVALLVTNIGTLYLYKYIS